VAQAARDVMPMKPMEFLRAAGLAFVVLLFDVLLAVGAVYVWGKYFAPGHTQEYYETAGVPIARWSTRILGTALIFGTSWLAVHQRPERNAYGFAGAIVFFYALLDGASVAFEDFFNGSIALTMLLKLLGALAGAYLAQQGRPPAIR
jgi:hypothetical protein